MTAKERAALRGQANTLETIYQIGKDGIDEALVRGVGEALKARELIKLRLQDGALLDIREAAEELAKQLDAEVVQVIGRRFVLYKQNREINRYGIK